MKKEEFETYWERTLVQIAEGRLPIDKCFEREHHGHHFVMIPCNVRFMDLTKFEGKKTKVTIEVID